MAKTSKGKSKAKDLEINIDGNVRGKNVLIGSGNIVNLPPEHIKLNTLHQLPPAPADFTGRAELISQLLSDFNAHKGATISGLTGMGGIGKTALGLEVANKIKDQYPDAQIFLDLKGTTAPLSALDIIRHVILSFEPTADLRGLNESNMQAAYQSLLYEKKALLFFDNARSAEQIAPLRPPAECAMLVTSRWTFPVTGLQAHRVDVLSEAHAINFLLELCPRITDKAADLANACAYLPLALRIAGSFLLVNSDWSVEKYLSQLSDRKKRLETLKQSRTDAELTTEPDLLATFELSYNALPEEDRKRWRTLGVFPAWFAGNAAQAMWGLDEDTTNKLLGALRRYSLLDYDETNSRYVLHDLLADYALTQMEDEEEQEALIKHATHYAEILGELNQMLLKGGENILPCLRLYDVEWVNIEFGQKNSATYLEQNSEAAEASNWFAWQGTINNLRLNPKKQIQWIKDGLRASIILKNKSAEGAHLGNLGLAYANLGEVQKAIEFYEQDLSIAREIGDRRGEGAVLGNLGLAYADLGEVQKAIEFYEQQLVIVREIGDRRGEGNALGNLGVAYKNLGDARKAIEFCEQALLVAREIGDKRSEGADLGNLGNAYNSLGDARKAIDFYEQALLVARKIGDRRNEGNWLGNLGNAYYSLGNVQKAIEFYEQQLLIVREIGDRRGEGAALGNQGLAYAALGEIKKAIEFYEQFLSIAREIGDRRGEGAALGNLGLAYAGLGDSRKAIEFYEQFLSIAREIGDRRGEGNALFNMGVAMHGLDEKDKAIDLVKQALVIYEAIESPIDAKARNALKEWGA